MVVGWWSEDDRKAVPSFGRASFGRAKFGGRWSNVEFAALPWEGATGSVIEFHQKRLNVNRK